MHVCIYINIGTSLFAQTPVECTLARNVKSTRMPTLSEYIFVSMQSHSSVAVSVCVSVCVGVCVCVSLCQCIADVVKMSVVPRVAVWYCACTMLQCGAVRCSVVQCV